MKVMAIGTAVKPLSQEERLRIMSREVPHTLELYLDGTIEQYWFREDTPGVIFLMSVESVEKAQETVNALPLTAGGFLHYELMQVGPLKPLGLLLQSN